MIFIAGLVNTGQGRKTKLIPPGKATISAPIAKTNGLSTSLEATKDTADMMTILISMSIEKNNIHPYN
jgi:hypothetical protein